MSEQETNNYSARSARLSEQYMETVDYLDRHSVPFYSIGSMAASAYLGTRLDLNRPHPDPSMQVPDFDMVVPKADLPLVREYREKLIQSDFPVRIGLAIPSQAIDWRPGAASSYLVSGRERREFDSSLLDTADVESDLGNIRTVSPRLLAEHYGIIAGHLRDKDKPIVEALSGINRRQDSDVSDKDLTPFAEHRRSQRHNLKQQSIYAAKLAHDKLSPEKRAKLTPVIRFAASGLKLR